MKTIKAAEAQIRKAQAEGQFDNLPGAGKPLPRETGDSATAAGYRIMSAAGALPDEIRLKKEIDTKLLELAALSNPAERKAAMARLVDLQMHYSMAQEARRAFNRD